MERNYAETELDRVPKRGIVNSMNSMNSYGLFGKSITRKKIQGKLLRKWPKLFILFIVYKPFINRVHLVVM